MAEKMKGITTAVLLLFFEGIIYAAAEYREDFDKPESVDSWQATTGSWELDIEGQKYVHSRDVDSLGYARAISNFKITDGEIEVGAVITQERRYSPGFGIMVKFIDSRNWMALRFNPSINIRVVEDGKGRSIRTGHRWDPEVDRPYTGRIIVRGDRAMVFLDDQIIASVEGLPFAGVEGYTGLFVYASSVSYDFFRVKRN